MFHKSVALIAGVLLFKIYFFRVNKKEYQQREERYAGKYPDTPNDRNQRRTFGRTAIHEPRRIALGVETMARAEGYEVTFPDGRVLSDDALAQ